MHRAKATYNRPNFTGQWNFGDGDDRAYMKGFSVSLSAIGAFLAMGVFILLLAESLIYLWIKGVLSWK